MSKKIYYIKKGTEVEIEIDSEFFNVFPDIRKAYLHRRDSQINKPKNNGMVFLIPDDDNKKYFVTKYREGQMAQEMYLTLKYQTKNNYKIALEKYKKVVKSRMYQMPEFSGWLDQQLYLFSIIDIPEKTLSAKIPRKATYIDIPESEH